ncbi:MAG: tRNA (adenosine(37)-N6)-dimethylallyltransferase MiaA [Flammeovirgaceae bacterium]|nr:tRNA (adenosine(37)-N6)-dimethylallyltransferase MiaA [Flammeovirgaceae bacterium]
MPEKFLIVIAGPTAIGKTKLSIKLAKQLNTAIINADSRQVYKDLKIGTAKPSLSELSEARHYLVDFLPIHTTYNAGQFEKDALNLLDSLFQEKNVVIVSGGSGLYIKALCEGMDDIPKVSNHFREELNRSYQDHGIGLLLKELEQKDPEYFSFVDKSNTNRIIRALEIIRGTGKKFSSFRNAKKKNRDFTIIKIGLERNREELYELINLRMDLMIEKGLVNEAIAIKNFKNCNALQTVGYREIYDYFDGKYNWEEAVRLLKRNSRRYAKRQMTWFKGNPEYHWFHPENFEDIFHFIQRNIGNS